MKQITLVLFFFLPLINPIAGQVKAETRPQDKTEAQYHELINWFWEKHHQWVAKHGAELVIERDWKEITPHASARREGKKWIIRILGGMFRHPAITRDGFILTLCHELGHHLGGAPKKKEFLSESWSSAEGQADYWASLKCFPRLFEHEDNKRYVELQNITALVKNQCEKAHINEASAYLCMRNALAGLSVATFYNRAENTTRPLRFDQPDLKKVTKTNLNHPLPQCRLDTHFQGALCSVDWRIMNNQTDPHEGFCHPGLGQIEGSRPRCWYRDPKYD